MFRPATRQCQQRLSRLLAGLRTVGTDFQYLADTVLKITVTAGFVQEAQPVAARQ